MVEFKLSETEPKAISELQEQNKDIDEKMCSIFLSYAITKEEAMVIVSEDASITGTTVSRTNWLSHLTDNTQVRKW